MQACLRQQLLLSAVLSAIAVLFRQTNAVWVAYVLGVRMLLRVAPLLQHPTRMAGGGLSCWHALQAMPCSSITHVQSPCTQQLPHRLQEC